MRAPRTLVFAALLALALTPLARAQEAVPGGPAAFEDTLTDLAERARARTVLIYGLVGLGSGAVVSHEGRVVTNAHVVAGARYAIVQWANGEQALFRRRGIDYGADLAILEPMERLAQPVPAFSLAERAPREGDWVLGAGFPGGLRTTPEPTISLGRITGNGGGPQTPGGFLNYSNALRSDVPIFSGNSGGPMIDLRGRLVGINGAVDLQKARSLTIPIEVVHDRLLRLKKGIIILPTGQTLNPNSGLLRPLFRATDAMARSMPERVAQASRQAARVERGARERAVDLRGRLPEGARERLDALRDRSARATLPDDTLADIARRSPRQSRLANACRDRSRAGLIGNGELHLTPVGPQHAVCKASLLQGRALQVQGSPAVVVAISPADDLALVHLSKPLTELPVDAPARPVGSLVYARGEDGLVAAGMLSATARPTSASVLARIQQGSGGPLSPVIGLLERLAKTLRSDALRQLLEQIKRSSEVQRSFASGTPPRAYREVISVDAPVTPSRMGAPLLDRHGRLIGVTVGIAHFGTTYVVPIRRVRQAFAEQLGGAEVPERIGTAKLY